MRDRLEIAVKLIVGCVAVNVSFIAYGLYCLLPDGWIPARWAPPSVFG